MQPCQRSLPKEQQLLSSSSSQALHRLTQSNDQKVGAAGQAVAAVRVVIAALWLARAHQPDLHTQANSTLSDLRESGSVQPETARLKRE